MKFYVLTEKKRNKSAAEIEKALHQAWSNVPSTATIYRWFNTEEEESQKEETRGRKKTVTTEDNVEEIKFILDVNPNASTRAIAEEAHMSKETVRQIIVNNLQMSKVCSTWIPHQLNENQKELRIGSAKAIRNKIIELGDEATKLLAFEDETWVYFNQHLSKAENKVWLKKGEKRPTVVKPSIGDKKTMLLIAYTSDKKFSVEATNGESITAERYVEFVRNTGDRWRTLRRSPTKLSELTWQHDNARPHCASVVKDFFSRRDIKCVWQSPYSPDLNMLDRWVNKELKKQLRQSVFTDGEEVKNEALRILRDIPESRYTQELDRLLEYCQKVIESGGVYVI